MTASDRSYSLASNSWAGKETKIRSSTDSLVYRRFRAPQADGAVLLEPGVKEIDSIWADNKRRLDSCAVDIDGMELAELRSVASRELLDSAIDYSCRYLDKINIPSDSERASLLAAAESGALVLSGHQPELFHPGVWFKNFALDAFASRLNVSAVNLVIDNDICSEVGIRVPVRDADLGRIEQVPFDDQAPGVPWECRGVRSESCFATFAKRVAAIDLPYQQPMLLTELWQESNLNAVKGMRLGERLAAMRHRYECAIGLRNWELPLSHVCETASFRHFAAALIGSAAHLRDVHNRAVREYRRIHRLRSQTHPVPELRCEDGWVELPFWIWPNDQGSTQQRQPLFVRTAGTGSLELSDLGENSLSSGKDELFHSLTSWSEERGVAVRPRALVTTMYARLVLSRLFMHGIGGAKYDQITDLLIREMFDLEPPEYLVGTATILLSIDLEAADEQERLELIREERRLAFQPERSMAAKRLRGTAAWDQLEKQKLMMLQSRPEQGSRRDWHREVVALNHALQPLLGAGQAELEVRKADYQRRKQISSLFGSREFSFVLHAPSMPSRLSAMIRDLHIDDA